MKLTAFSPQMLHTTYEKVTLLCEFYRLMLSQATVITKDKEEIPNIKSLRYRKILDKKNYTRIYISTYIKININQIKYKQHKMNLPPFTRGYQRFHTMQP